MLTKDLVDSPSSADAKLDTAVAVPQDGSDEQPRHAADAEHRLGLLAVVRLYPQAVGWSIFFSLGVIMCAFDPQLLGQLYATPAFQKGFGYNFKVRRCLAADYVGHYLMRST